MMDFEDELIEAFITEIDGYIPQLRGYLVRLRTDPKHRDSLDECYRLAHTIKGSAAMLSFDDLSELGHQLEQYFADIVEKKAKLTPTIHAAATATVEKVAQNLARIVAARATIGEITRRDTLEDRLTPRQVPEEVLRLDASASAPSEAVQPSSPTPETDDDLLTLLSELNLESDLETWKASLPAYAIPADTTALPPELSTDDTALLAKLSFDPPPAAIFAPLDAHHTDIFDSEDLTTLSTMSDPIGTGFGGYSDNDLADLGLTDDELAQLIAMDAAQQAEGNPGDFGGMFVAEAHTEIKALHAHITALSTNPTHADPLHAIANKLRKGATTLDLEAIANSVGVIESLSGMVTDGSLGAGAQRDRMFTDALHDLDNLLEPYQAAAQAILAGLSGSENAAPTSAVVEPEIRSAIEMVRQETTPIVTLDATEADEEDFAAVFAQEADEHIRSLDTNLLALERAPHNREVLREIRRVAHTLKGSAAMVELHVISQTAHLMEDLLDRLYERTHPVDSPVIGLLFQTFNVIEDMVRGLRAGKAEDPALLDDLRPAYADLLDDDGSVAPADSPRVGIFDSSPFAQAVTQQTQEINSAFATDNAETAQDHALTDSAQDADPLPTFANVTASAGVAPHAIRDSGRDTEQLAVRVDIKQLDAVMNQVGELVINRSILERRSQIFGRTVEELRLTIQRMQRATRELANRYEVEFLQDTQIGDGTAGSSIPAYNPQGTSYRVLSPSQQMFALPAHTQDFDSLEFDRYTAFHSLTRDLTEAVADLAATERELAGLRGDLENITIQQSRITADLQDRLVSVRLVPLANLTPRLHRTVRTIAQAQGKDVQFVVTGETTPVDKTIFEEIADPLLHIVRNAIDHGIETPEARVAKGKTPGGIISLNAHTEGNQVLIEVRDDGAGIDPAWVRQRAIERGLLAPDAPLTEGQAMEMLFRPGFSTAENITEYSGRGIGLDVVRANIQRLKGTVDIATTPDNGTRITLRLPITLAITQALLFSVDNLTYATPITVIERTTRLDPARIMMLGDQPVYRLDDAGDDLAPLLRLGDKLRIPAALRPPVPQDTQPTKRRAKPVIVINAPQRKIALVVDDLMEQQEIVVKGLGLHLQTLQGIIGATILGSGHVVPILDLYAIVGSFGLNLDLRNVSASSLSQSGLAGGASRSNFNFDAPSSTPLNQRIPVIQVVDDSLSIRRVVSASLEKAGFVVRTSKDGQEALDAVQRAAPDLFIMDIEMPRMDGYELTSILKSRAAFRHIPIVMLTSRAGAKHRQRAEEVGADGYIIKPYQETDLLHIVNELVARSRNAQAQQAVAIGQA